MSSAARLAAQGQDFHRREIFWGEIAPWEHMVQIYEDEQVFLDTLEGYVVGGLTLGEGVVVIATLSHRTELELRIVARGIDLQAALDEHRYMSLDAAESLARFYKDGKLDGAQFNAFVLGVLELAGVGGRKVRAFGEMVALLWAEGYEPAALELEELWHQFCTAHALSLLCAYPRADLALSQAAGIEDIVRAHTRVVAESYGSALPPASSDA